MNTFGRKFRLSIFGESHGSQIGVIIDGLSPGLKLCEDDFTADILRRKAGAKGTTPRSEADVPVILSGVYEGVTTGAPLCIVFANTNTKSGDYRQFRDMPRPGHADYSAMLKYDECNDPRGGGHFSGRLTLPIVAAGVIAKKQIADVIRSEEGECSIDATLIEVGGEKTPSKWDAMLSQAMSEGDSLGGIVECKVVGLPAGLGEPFFDSVESLISHAIFSIPGVRGIEFGDGFKASAMKGSEHNDPLALDEEGFVAPAKNGAGGVNGGITNGAPLVFRVAFKPTSSISKTQRTFNFASWTMEDIKIPGRHDCCFALRTPVIVEAMTAIVLADFLAL